MNVLRFGEHDVPYADILNARVNCSFTTSEIYVDIEVQGGGVMSLNLHDSLRFMEAFIEHIRTEKNISR
jgi:hypothetical protein